MNRFISAIILFSFSYSSYAELYKHIDKKGHIVYSKIKDSGSKINLDTSPIFSGYYNDFKYEYAGSEALPESNSYTIKIYYESVTGQQRLFNDIIPYVAQLEKIQISCLRNLYAVSEIEFYESINYGLHRYSYFPTVSERILKTITPDSPYQKAYSFVCKGQSEAK